MINCDVSWALLNFRFEKEKVWLKTLRSLFANAPKCLSKLTSVKMNFHLGEFLFLPFIFGLKADGFWPSRFFGKRDAVSALNFEG